LNEEGHTICNPIRVIPLQFNPYEIKPEALRNRAISKNNSTKIPSLNMKKEQ
jgi:hypothetical protein